MKQREISRLRFAPLEMTAKITAYGTRPQKVKLADLGGALKAAALMA